MDYNYFASTGPQLSQYLVYGTDAGLPYSGASNNATSPSSSVENLHERNAFLSGPYDYAFFEPSLSASTFLQSLPSTMLPIGSIDSGRALHREKGPRSRGSSTKEKDSLTSAQSRRKAQNRASQRAFRERKERYTQDLEAKLNLLTTIQSSLQSDNERLKLELQQAQTKNEILSATLSSSPLASCLTLAS